MSAGALPWGTLKPFISLVILECTAEDQTLAFGLLESQLGKPGKSVPDTVSDVVAVSASGEDEAPQLLTGLGFDDVAGFVRRHQRPPAWTTPDSGIADTRHDLTVMLRRGRLVAVRTASDIARRLQHWLDQPAKPYRRVEPDILEGAMLRGETKGLWLQDTRRPSINRALTKTYGGPSLQNALNQMDDGNYSMGAGKAKLLDDGSRTVLKGIIGTTPPDSTVWFKASADLYEFGLAVVEILNMLEEEQTAGPRPAIPFVARPVTDLTLVHEAYDIAIADIDQLPTEQVDDDLAKAADILQSVTFEVHGTPGSDLRLDVGYGSKSGTLLVTTRMSDARCVVGIGPDPLATHSDSATTQEIASALNDYPELLSVYYRSGHSLSNRRMLSEQLPQGGFSGWRFEDFSGYTLTQEKPKSDKAQDMHNLIGKPGEKSLFSWVVGHYNQGWLTCDDGPEEVADFIHIASDLTLTLIHVKGAASSSPGRGVATTAYEVVAGQATKNSRYLMDRVTLQKELESPGVDEPATWTDGKRVDDREEFLKALARRDAASLAQIVIVQPHLSEVRYAKLNATRSAPPPSNNLLRLMRLEDLLHSAMTTAVSRKAGLTVLAARE